MGQDHGRFCWYDTMTKDTEGARAFYGKVFGWTTEAVDMGDPPYTMWKNGETPFGGLMTLPEEAAAAGAPPHWLAYVNVDDVEATTRRAVELGSCVLVPVTDVPGMGRFSVFADPQGATIALWMTTSGETAPETGPRVGQVSWHELATTDAQAAAAFYHELFGWKTIHEHDMGEMGTYREFGRAAPTGGMFDRPAEMPVSAWLLYVLVADLEATMARVTTAGGQVVNGPMEVPGGDRIAQCMDPQGAMFALHQRASE